jgi:hypothetical protein
MDAQPVNHPDDPPPYATVEAAIAVAAQALPEKVEPADLQQPSLPGLRPQFDLKGALDAIEDQERAASAAEQAYAAAAEKAKALRKLADAQNAKLRELIRTLNARRHDARYEPKESDDGSEAVSAGSDAHAVSDGVSDMASLLADLQGELAQVEDGATAPASPLGPDHTPRSEGTAGASPVTEAA